MNVKEIVEQYLRENGYDGLYNEICACGLDTLMGSGCCEGECKPGFVGPCLDDGDIVLWTYPTKEAAEAAKVEYADARRSLCTS